MIPNVAGTFLELVKLAKFDGAIPKKKKEHEEVEEQEKGDSTGQHHKTTKLGISYTINLNLPPTTEIEVFNAIFKSLKEHILNGNNLSELEQLKIFGMQNLLLESALAKLESAGIEIGHSRSIKKDDVVDTEFDKDIRRESRRMAEFYALYYCLENTVRRLISERLQDKHKLNWWDVAIQDSMKREVQEKQEKENDTVLAIRSKDPLSYTNFVELIVILEANWDCFSDTIRSRKAMQQTLSQFNHIRNVIAHSCSLSENDITRFKLLINDWLNIQS